MSFDGEDSAMDNPLIERLQQVPVLGGFRQEGYFIWGGSIIKTDGQYHLFASRWPESTGFPEGYRAYSEIVRATASRAVGPYEFAEVVVTGRGAPHWDGRMCHNPKIVKIRDTFVLYYIGSACDCGFRQIGYAWSSSVKGPWERVNEPIHLGADANNPAPCVHADGSILLGYRDQSLHMHVARAPSFSGPYQVIARDIFPQGKLEDPDISFLDGEYHMVMEDNQGVLTGHARFGGHLVSPDGVQWHPHSSAAVYTHDVLYDNGTSITVDRRERPQLFHDASDTKDTKTPTHLITSVWYQGKAWSMIQPIGEDIESNNSMD
jgi:hypothetical protein